MDSIHTIESRLRKAENALGVRFTLIDNNGLFRHSNGGPLFPPARQSHRPQPVCDAGYGSACVEHCRHWVTSRGEEDFDRCGRQRQNGSGTPFIHTCWKGLREIAAPLWADGVHVGTLFAGVWRAAEVRPPWALLPPEFAAVYRCLPVMRPHNKEDLRAVLAWLATGLVHDLIAAVPGGAAGLTKQDEAGRIARFIEYRLHRPLRLKELSDYLHKSPSRVSHLMREIFGTSFQALLRRKRMDRAGHLLVQTDMAVAAVAERSGFSDPRYFSRAFRAYYRTTPSAYRRTKRNEDSN